MKDFMYVAVVRKDWEAFAILQGFAENVLVEGVTTFRYKPGYAVDEIGRITTDPGEYDNSSYPPVEIRAPTYDERFHVNLRIVDEEIAAAYVAEGVPAVANVTWLDPSTVSSPYREWLGGMDYYREVPV